MSMSHFCRAWWARWGLGSLAGGKRYHFSPGYTTHAITTTSPCTRITIVTHPTTAVQTLVLSTDGDQIVHCRNWTALSHSSPTSQPITNRIEHRQLSVLCA